MNIKIRPLGNRVLVKRAESRVSKGGILLPETAQEKPKEGEVIAVGPGKEDKEGNRIPMSLNVGDKVLFTSYAGTEFKPEGEEKELLIISEDDILAVIK